MMMIGYLGCAVSVAAASKSGKAAAATGILTCADDGTFAVKLDLDTSRLYVEGDHSHFSNLAGFAGTYPGVRMDLSAECSERTIYKSFFLDYSDIGHPPIDPIGGGGWGVPHYDAHFNTKSAATIEAYTCAAGAVPVQCDMGIATTGTDSEKALLAKMNNEAPTDYTTGFYLDQSWGGQAVIGHGHHLLPIGDESFIVKADPAFPEFDATCTGGPCGPPAWTGCAGVTQGAPDAGCRYGPASLTSIMITYDGEVIGEEVMFTKGTIAGMLDGNSMTKAYPQPNLSPHDHAGKFRALQSRIDIVGTKARVGFDLIAVVHGAHAKGGKAAKGNKGSKEGKEGKKGGKGKDGKAGQLTAAASSVNLGDVSTATLGIAAAFIVAVAAAVVAATKRDSVEGTYEYTMAKADEPAANTALL